MWGVYIVAQRRKADVRTADVCRVCVSVLAARGATVSSSTGQEGDIDVGLMEQLEHPGGGTNQTKVAGA